ncbi:MAG: rRNA pseudouridine synthase [Defluviitaleaceae bacterium]|nr:rRNA pseudouridine synthase [Defluviitaleaceae bacterium]
MTRLQKILAQAGVASRRKCEEIILAGRVAVNGETICEPGAKADADSEILVDGKKIAREKKFYIAFHKPAGVVTTAFDPQGRPTVMDFVPRDVRLFPVGRLDFDTSGLLILTNDGDFANKLSHPSHEIKKTYIATLRGKISRENLQKFRRGIKIDGRLTAPAEIKILREENSQTVAEISIREGRNRQVRKMCDAVGCPVIALKRVAIGGVQLGDLPVGKWRELENFLL